MPIGFVTTPCTILSGASLSGIIHLHTGRLFAVQMPSAWTAANLTFQGSFDGGTTFVDMYDDAGTEVTITAGASRYIQVANPMAWFAVQVIKVRSGTTGAPVVQGADRLIELITAV